MNLIQVLFISFVSFFPGADKRVPEQPIAIGKDCREIRCSAAVVDSSDGLGNGAIQITFTDNRSFFRIAILSADGKKDVDDSKSTIDFLKKGKYLVVVTGKDAEPNFCPRYFELAIK
jgi:hypothetical protein